MGSSLNNEADTAAGSIATDPPDLAIWCDWKGEFYAFCDMTCLRHYGAWVSDPNYLFEKATWTETSFGCKWCGGDLMRGTISLSQGLPAPAPPGGASSR
jgi:hypothetical protein